MIKKIAKIAGVLAFSYAILFVAVVYPNDDRLSFPDIKALKQIGPQFSEPALLSGKWPDFALSLSESDYKKAFEVARKATPHYLGENYGMASPFLLNHSLGDYPDRVEGRQGINLPVGEWIEFSPALAGSFQLEFKSTSIGGSPELGLYKNKTKIDKLKLNPPPDPTDITSNYYQYFSKYWSVDRRENAHPWLQKKLSIDFSSEDKLRFECKGAAGFCFISRPVFLEIAKKQKANYLVILVDTLKQSGVTKKDAPVMDGLRQYGREYTETYSAGNLTSQSTNAFLSCQKPSDIGALAFSYNMPPLAKTQFYAKGQPSFSHLFKRAGWRTAMIGNVSVISEVMGAGIDHGFEEQIAIEREAYDTGKIAGEAIRWLQDNGDKPFFLYLHFHATHAPYRAPLRYIIETFRGPEDLASMPAILRWLYRAEVRYTDRYVKEVFEALKLLGLADTTKFVLTADHGDQQQIRTFTDNKTGFAKTGAFFDHGATLLNDEIHIPLIFVGFKDLTAGSVNDDIASNLDIGPTLLDDAGIDIPKWCDGLSLIEAARNSQKTNPFDRAIGTEGIRQRALYFGDRYKYTVSYSTTEKNLFCEDSYRREMFGLLDQDILIDLKADHDEVHNLYKENPQLLKTARTLFDSYFRTEYLWELVFESPDKSEMSAQFKAVDTPVKYQGLDSAENDGVVTLTLRDNQRGIATFDHPLTTLPLILEGSMQIPVLNTYAKLNLGSTDLGLPVENIGEDALLPVGSRKVAYLRKVAKSDFQARKTVAGNPQFEAILKEWGYLNDN